jgi:2-oxoglutarate ferredoxin oxidoreductase subunit alpha
MGKANDPGPGPDQHWQRIAEKFEEIGRLEQRWEAIHCRDAETVVVSFGTCGPFVDQVVTELRNEGVRIGAFRPISLWPFPEAALAEACQQAGRILVFEVNAGQMIDDVRLAVAGRAPVVPIGRVSIDFSGMRQGEILTVGWLRERLRESVGVSA